MAYKKNDPEKAAAWLKMASESGHLEAGSELNQICKKNPQWCRFTAN
jgi:TPR repeat protein